MTVLTESDVKPVGVTLGVLLSCLLKRTIEGPANYSQPSVTPEHHPYQKKKNYMCWKLSACVCVVFTSGPRPVKIIHMEFGTEHTL